MDDNKTKEQLIIEIGLLKTKVAELEKSEIEQKQYKQALIESEEKWRSLTQHSSDYIWTCDLNYNFVFVNKVATGLKREDIIGSSLYNFVPEEFHEGVKDCYEKIVKTKKQNQYLTNWEDSSGNTTFFEVQVSPMIKDGKITGFVSRSYDITERKLSETKISVERDKLTSILESMQDGVYIVNKDYDIEYVNPSLMKDFGLPSDKKCHKYFHGIDTPCTFCKNEDVFAGKKVQWEWTSPRNGKTYDLIDTPIKNSDGTVSKLEIFRDITYRKESENKIAQFGRIFEDSLNEIYLFDADTLIFKQVNNAAQANMGYSMDELQNMTPLDFKPEFTAELFAQEIEPLRNGEKQKILFETVHQRKDRSLYNVEVHLQLLQFEKENVFAAFIMDVTERKKVEEELAKHRKNLEQIVNERTVELEEKNKELDHALKVFVGREYKIKKLLERIKVLEGK